jgi:pentatricopeptide repeat protein
MSLLRALDRTSAVSHTVLARPFLAFLYPSSLSEPSKRQFSKAAIARPSGLTSDGPRMDSFFIQALARAGSCPEHARHFSTLRHGTPSVTSYHKTRRKGALCHHERYQPKSTKAERTGPLKQVKQFAAKELKALVDYYGIDLASEPKDDRVENEPLVWHLGDDRVPRTSDDPRVNPVVAMIKQLLEDEETPHALLFEAYRLLPAPGVEYLESTTIHALLHHLSVLERPTEIAMHRFLGILDDMKQAKICIIRSEWDTAIHLAGKFLGKVSNEELQSAMRMWREMEQQAGVQGRTVTFNILFDIAVKSGKYALADTFLNEMLARGLKFHRHFRVSLLYYYGVMKNGNGVRKVYHEMVESGDIIDTVVLNAVIAALSRAGEPGAAEHVFQRMKNMHIEKIRTFRGSLPFNVRTWRGRRSLGLHLTHEARALTDSGDLDKRKELQELAPIAPNSRTYSILIRHHARRVGDIDRVNELLREMGERGVPLEGSIFVSIFQAFGKFGGVRYSSWTPDMLEQSWKEYMKAVDQKLDRTWISKVAVVGALRAFRKCVDGERALRAWEQVRTKWEPSQADEVAVLQVLTELVPQKGFFDGHV